MKNWIQKAILVVLVLALPVLLFAHSWMGWKHYQLDSMIEEAEDRQLEIVERNKRLITGISILRSPGRIMDEARELGMVMAGRNQIRILEEDR